MANTNLYQLIYLLLLFDIRTCLCQNVSDNFVLPSLPMKLPYDSETELSNNQKQYVELLKAKLLAQERERHAKGYISQSYDYAEVHHADKSDEDFVDDPVKSIGSYLRKISNDELGVTAMQQLSCALPMAVLYVSILTKLEINTPDAASQQIRHSASQAIYDSLPSVNVPENLHEVVKDASHRLTRKIRDYLAILERNKLSVEELSQNHLHLFDVAGTPCWRIPIEILRYDEHFGVDVTKDSGCESSYYSQFPVGFNMGKNLSQVFKRNLEKNPSLLWQYYITVDGVHFEYPAYNVEIAGKWESKSDRHREIFQATVQPLTKHVVIVIDQGYSLSPHQFDTAKSVAKHVLSLLSPFDKVAVFGLAADVQYAHANSCMTQKMLNSTPETKFLLTRFIDGLVRKPNSTNHMLGFSKAYEIIPKADDSSPSYCEILIAYISRGLLSSLIDAKQVMEIIAEGNRNNKNHIVINTYAIIDDEKPVMYEKDFLQNIAEQNFKNYNVRSWGSQEIKKGVMVPINSTEHLASAVGNIFSAFPQHFSKTPIFSLPYWDPLSKGVVVSITQQVFHHEMLVGVVGIDVALADIAEDVSYISSSESRYSFLLHKSGIALTHPSFSHPPFISEHHVHSFIWHLEDHPGFLNIYEAILSESSGEKSLPVNQAGKIHKGKAEKLYVYRWKEVEGTPYIVCLVSEKPIKQRKLLKDTFVPEETDFIYHRLDLLPPRNMCRNMKQLSSLDSSALFFSAACFISPYKYLIEEESKQVVQNYMAYLTDVTKLIANPGLKTGIRSEVLALSRISPTWKSRALNHEFSNYVVRRFVATASGVFQVYPATLLDKTYDPTRRDWYIRAMEHPGKIILTAPYLDVGGAGYVITLSHTIYEGKPIAMHNSQDTVVAVMGMDFTFGYFYKFLLDKVPVCKHDNIICFLLDDRGYLIAHPELIEPSGRGPVEQQHITHKEPLVSNDMLNNKEFVSKKVCYSFSDRTIQRYYQLNTSLEGILTNQVHGEHCTKYQIMAVHGTNIFLGVVNQTCEGITAFCPCSMTDRLCLNCHRMEQTECECPCECPLKMDPCSAQSIEEDNRYPTCSHFPEDPNLPLVDTNILESFEPCYENHCSSRSSLSNCFGILGCEWCQLETDGTTPLMHKFCTDQRKCFGGVRGARTPYADEIVEGLPLEDFPKIKSTPVGPVAGGFMVFFLMVAVAFYCYRNHVRRGTTSHHSTSTPDTNLRMTQLKNEPDDLEPYQEPIKPVQPTCHLMSGAENVAVSPYRVHTNYRRPPGGDSDHGYSTMTPHEDSEHAPYFEPLLIGKEKYWTPSSQQSISSCSRTSSPVSSTHPNSAFPPMTYVTPTPVPKGDYLSSPCAPNKDPTRAGHPKGCFHGSYVLAQVQVHSADAD